MAKEIAKEMKKETEKTQKLVKTIFSPQIEIFVPFAQTVDNNRLNMSYKQGVQPMLSKNVDTPFMIDKEFQKISTIQSPFVEFAEDDGIVLHNDDNILVIYYKNQKKMITKHLPEGRKLIEYSLDLKYKIDKKFFKKGEVLYDYTGMNIENKLPKIGYRANILFTSFFGYNADDAIVISESFSKKAQKTVIKKTYIPILKHWKYFKIVRDEEKEIETYLPYVGMHVKDDYIKYLEIDTSKHFSSEIINADKTPSKFFTKKIDGLLNSDVVTMKLHIFNEDILRELRSIDMDQELTDESLKDLIKEIRKLDEKYIYTRGIINELEDLIIANVKKKKNVYDSFLNIGMNKEKAKELTEQIYSQYLSMEKQYKHYKQMLMEEYLIKEFNDMDFLIELDSKIYLNTTRGDKFTNLFAGKATIAMIIPDELMPKDPSTGKPFDMIFNSLGIPGRNNWGVVFELAVSKIIIDVENTVKKILEGSETIETLKEKINFINENFIKKYDLDYYQDVENIINNLDNEEFAKLFINDINKNNFYLYVPNFPNISYKELMNTFIKPYAKRFDLNIGKQKIKYSSELLEWLRKNYGFKDPFNDYNETELMLFSSWNYMLKLHHTSFGKFNSVSFTSAYSKITGQPVRGRKKGGGAHVSWQSLAALLAHKEDNAVLKEIYTIKSDALDEKQNFIIKYIRDGEYYLKDKYNSVTKKTLNNALHVFGMKFEDENEEL